MSRPARCIFALQVYDEVALLFKSHTDLLQEFCYFLPDSTPPSQAGTRSGDGGDRRVLPAYSAPPFPNFPHLQPARANRPQRANPAQKPGAKSRFSGDVARLPPVTQREQQFFERVKNKLKTREAYQDFLKCLNLFAQEVISKDEMVALVEELLGKTPDLRREFLDMMSKISEPSSLFSMNDIGGRSGRTMTMRDKYRMYPISDLDVSTWVKSTPSYRRLPDDYPILDCSHRSALAEQVLNDNWVSIASGSEDFSFKHFRKNLYGEWAPGPEGQFLGVSALPWVDAWVFIARLALPCPALPLLLPGLSHGASHPNTSFGPHPQRRRCSAARMTGTSSSFWWSRTPRPSAASSRLPRSSSR